LQLTECQFPAYSVLKPKRTGGGGRFVNFYRFYNKAQQQHFWNFILMTQCKLCMCGGGGGGSQQREVANGADGLM